MPHHLGRGLHRLPFLRAYLEQRVLSKAAWSTPEADHSSATSGGHAGGQMDCQGQFGEGLGALEQPAHNTTHDGFVGGTMADPGSAAEDPIFFSFHCYIDLLWAQWQEQFETDTDLGCRLCGLFTDREHAEENRFRVRDTLDIETQLGYVYEYTPGEVAPPPPVADDALFPTHPALDVVPSARAEPALVRTLDFTVPEPGVEEAVLRLAGVHVTLPFSYGADVYLTRPGEELRTTDRTFADATSRTSATSGAPTTRTATPRTTSPSTSAAPWTPSRPATPASTGRSRSRSGRAARAAATGTATVTGTAMRRQRR